MIFALVITALLVGMCIMLGRLALRTRGGEVSHGSKADGTFDRVVARNLRGPRIRKEPRRPVLPREDQPPTAAPDRVNEDNLLQYVRDGIAGLQVLLRQAARDGS